MDIRQLRSFVAIAQSGSFSEAARRLNIAQPALSRQLQQLETLLSAPLFSRTVRGISLTPAGARLFPFALDLLQQFKAIPDIVAGPQADVVGQVTIGLPISVSAILSLRLIKAVQSSFPGVKLSLIESLSGHLFNWVSQSELDFSFLYDPEPAPNMLYHPILVERLSLVCAPDMFPEDTKEIPLRDIANLRLLMPTRLHSVRRLVEMLADRHGIKLNVAMETDSLSIVKSAMINCGYCSITSAAAVDEEIAAGKLRSLAIVEPDISRSVVLARSAVRGRTRASLEVANLAMRLTRELCEEGRWPGELVTVGPLSGELFP